MPFNPIKTLGDSFEKLITEHGSAVIQEKHIALLREQLAILDKQFSVLSSENGTLKSENETLKSQNQALVVENDKLRQKIQEYEQPHETLLDPIEEEILLLLHGRKRMQEEVAKLKNLYPDVAKMHLMKLFDLGMATTSQGADRKLYWHIKELGTRYLKDHNLITQQGVPVDG